MDSTILVSCSKPSRNRFARFDPNGFGFSNGIRPENMDSHQEQRSLWQCDDPNVNKALLLDCSTSATEIGST